MTIGSPLESQLRTQLRALREADFQHFVIKLLFQIYGIDGFQGLRPVRDKGSDGLIASEKCCIACYGPDRATFSSFRKKVKEDYGQYKVHWLAENPAWRVYINRDPSPDEIKLVHQLHAGSQVWGTVRIME